MEVVIRQPNFQHVFDLRLLLRHAAILLLQAWRDRLHSCVTVPCHLAVSQSF